MFLITFIIISGLFAQSDVVPTPESMEQLLNDSTIEQPQQNIEQDTETKNIIKKNKAKDLKNKKLRAKKLKAKSLEKLKAKRLKSKALKSKKLKANKNETTTGGEGSNE